MSELEALTKAIEICGGQSALANLLGVRQSTVWNWLNRDQRAAPNKCREIEFCVASIIGPNDEVTRYSLRPDVFGHSQAA